MQTPVKSYGDVGRTRPYASSTEVKEPSELHLSRSTGDYEDFDKSSEKLHFEMRYLSISIQTMNFIMKAKDPMYRLREVNLKRVDKGKQAISTELFDMYLDYYLTQCGDDLFKFLEREHPSITRAKVAHRKNLHEELAILRHNNQKLRKQLRETAPKSKCWSEDFVNLRLQNLSEGNLTEASRSRDQRKKNNKKKHSENGNTVLDDSIEQDSTYNTVSSGLMAIINMMNPLAKHSRFQDVLQPFICTLNLG